METKMDNPNTKTKTNLEDKTTTDKSSREDNSFQYLLR
jgi:hypothetical protein